MIKDTTDMLNLRWRAAQWLLAGAEGDKTQQSAVLAVLRIEGVGLRDFLDEIVLLRQQFGHRPVVLRDEVARMWSRLKVRT